MLESFNLTLVECKSGRPLGVLTCLFCFNLTLVECKFITLDYNALCIVKF